jgi:hypothetical protein
MLIRLIMRSSAEIGTQENSRGTRELTPVNSGQLTTIRQSITTLVKLCPSRSGTPLGANRLSGSRDSNDPQTSGSPVRRWCGTSLLVMTPSLFQRFLARLHAKAPRSNIHSACERAYCTISTSTFRASAGLLTSLKNAMRAPRIPSGVRKRT